MTKVKLSPVMVEALRYAARMGYQGSLSYRNRKTEDALLNRGLTTYEHNVKDDDGSQWLYPVITVAGWAWLKENFGTERPADEGRATLEEALEEVHTNVIEEANRLTAAKDAHARHLSVDEALEEAYPSLPKQVPGASKPPRAALDADLGRRILDGLRAPSRAGQVYEAEVLRILERPAHATEKPYQCTVCRWRFVTETGLRRHSEGHSGWEK